MYKKQLDLKDKEVNFKIYEVTAWLANNYNSSFATYITK